MANKKTQNTMDDSERAENMAEPLREIYDDAASQKAFVATAQKQFCISRFAANLAWHLIDSS